MKKIKLSAVLLMALSTLGVAGTTNAAEIAEDGKYNEEVAVKVNPAPSLVQFNDLRAANINFEELTLENYSDTATLRDQIEFTVDILNRTLSTNSYTIDATLAEADNLNGISVDAKYLVADENSELTPLSYKNVGYGTKSTFNGRLKIEVSPKEYNGSTDQTVMLTITEGPHVAY
ncbi:hypothetical protein GIX45_24345 [Erwinia sp. CPCC 100877]|nr:hypothetical protein [Erwinia sp. CPCC 100877]